MFPVVYDCYYQQVLATYNIRVGTTSRGACTYFQAVSMHKRLGNQRTSQVDILNLFWSYIFTLQMIKSRAPVLFLCSIFICGQSVSFLATCYWSRARYSRLSGHSSYKKYGMWHIFGFGLTTSGQPSYLIAALRRHIFFGRTLSNEETESCTVLPHDVDE